MPRLAFVQLVVLRVHDEVRAADVRRVDLKVSREARAEDGENKCSNSFKVDPVLFGMNSAGGWRGAKARRSTGLHFRLCRGGCRSSRRQTDKGPPTSLCNRAYRNLKIFGFGQSSAAAGPRRRSPACCSHRCWSTRGQPVQSTGLSIELSVSNRRRRITNKRNAQRS